MITKFYEFSQNNSGGYFDVDENVCSRVIIEAEDMRKAIFTFAPMIINQSPSCPCCGDRWYADDPWEVDLEAYKIDGYGVGVYSHYPDAKQRWMKLYGHLPRITDPAWERRFHGTEEFFGKVYFENIEQYCQFMANTYPCWTTPYIRIHLLNGTKLEFNKTNI